MFWSPTIRTAATATPTTTYARHACALQILEDDEDRPILTWGIEVSSTRLINACRLRYGDGTAKQGSRHRTVTVVDEKTFEYSNKVPQKISSMGGAVCPTVARQRPLHLKPQEAGSGGGAF